MEEKKSYNNGGQVIRHEPLTTLEMMSSPLSKHCFQGVGCFPFCEKVERVKYNATLTKSISTQLKRKKVTISGITFTISNDVVVEATGIPNHGENGSRTKT